MFPVIYKQNAPNLIMMSSILVTLSSSITNSRNLIEYVFIDPEIEKVVQ